MRVGTMAYRLLLFKWTETSWQFSGEYAVLRFTYEKTLWNNGTASITFLSKKNLLDTLKPLNYLVLLLDGDTLKYWGILKHIEVYYNWRWWTTVIRAKEFLDVFRYRCLYDDLNMTSYTTRIAWELINYTQSKYHGDYYIRKGTLIASDNISIDWEGKGVDIKSKLLDLSTYGSGFDFRFDLDFNSTNLKIYQIKYNTYSFYNNKTIHVNENEHSLFNNLHLYADLDAYNVVIIEGDGIVTHQELVSDGVRIEKKFTNSEIKNIDELNEMAYNKLELGKTNKIHFDADFVGDELPLGKNVVFNLNDGSTFTYRVWRVKRDESGKTELTLGVGRYSENIY